jgi:hypothetical protein
MNNSELLLNTPTLILIGGTLILGIFGGWFFASYLMRASINHLLEQNKQLRDYFMLIGEKIHGFEKMKQYEYHNILKEIKGILRGL